MAKLLKVLPSSLNCRILPCCPQKPGYMDSYENVKVLKVTWAFSITKSFHEKPMIKACDTRWHPSLVVSRFWNDFRLFCLSCRIGRGLNVWIPREISGHCYSEGQIWQLPLFILDLKSEKLMIKNIFSLKICWLAWHTHTWKRLFGKEKASSSTGLMPRGNE